MGGGAYSNANHLRTLGEQKRDGQKDQEVANKTKLKGIVQYFKGADRRLILRYKSTGVWMRICVRTYARTIQQVQIFLFELVWGGVFCSHKNGDTGWAVVRSARQNKMDFAFKNWVCSGSGVNPGTPAHSIH